VFRKLLVANRGEIACRVLRTCRRLGIATVAVYSDADATAPHVAMADEAVRLGPAPASESYLNPGAILHALEHSGVDAVHPGYGLLSERSDFARLVQRSGVAFVGPPPDVLDVFGDKVRARQLARSVDVPPPPGADEALRHDDLGALRRVAERIGYPLLVKGVGAGGGIGMGVATNLDQLVTAARACADRARRAFGDERVYVEKYLEAPRHIEVQVFCDTHGHAVALGERECTVQRRYQKVIEETPSPAEFFQGQRGARRRRELWEAALRVVRAVGYVGAGTVEFVADVRAHVYFLEVNARLQVEHPVTELVTGLDLVELQLRIAAGEPLPDEALRPTFSGHAVEARVYAEDPSRRFAPQPGKIERLRWPGQVPGIRIDAGVSQGGEVTPHYDPLLAKVVAHGQNRSEAISRLEGALSATTLDLMGPRGPRTTNLQYLRRVLASDPFTSGAYAAPLGELLAAGG
jgi:acetyl-CoA carboxylase biotin carboxylase subunit/3-methylcrotonyl-CoA carboxylase alpha subunit